MVTVFKKKNIYIYIYTLYIDRVPDELWMEVHDTVQEAEIKTIPKKEEMHKGKMVVLEGLTNS